MAPPVRPSTPSFGGAFKAPPRGLFVFEWPPDAPRSKAHAELSRPTPAVRNKGESAHVLGSSNWRHSMARQQEAKNVDKRETFDLIGSDKVEGTEVYRSNGDHVGEIQRIMIDKRSGKVAYAVMSFGGVLGLGQDYYPLPWSLLTYNERLGGYEVNVSDEQLRGAPKYGRNDNWDWADADRGRRVYDYYSVPFPGV
jgi:hypothetical protein